MIDKDVIKVLYKKNCKKVDINLEKYRVNLSMEQMMQNNTIVKELNREATKPMKEMLEYLNKVRP